MLLKSVFAGIASMCFGMYFNSPKKSLTGSFFAGTTGMLIYYILLKSLESKFIALVVGSMTIGFLTEILARKNKMPATVYLVPSLIPLVPGLAMFKTMQAIASQNTSGVTSNGTDAIISSTALALGIVISTIFSRSINRVVKREIEIKNMEKQEKGIDNK